MANLPGLLSVLPAPWAGTVCLLVEDEKNKCLFCTFSSVEAGEHGLVFEV